jgi:hypothetical protein
LTLRKEKEVISLSDDSPSSPPLHAVKNVNVNKRSNTRSSRKSFLTFSLIIILLT